MESRVAIAYTTTIIPIPFLLTEVQNMAILPALESKDQLVYIYENPNRVMHYWSACVQKAWNPELVEHDKYIEQKTNPPLDIASYISKRKKWIELNKEVTTRPAATVHEYKTYTLAEEKTEAYNFCTEWKEVFQRRINKTEEDIYLSYIEMDPYRKWFKLDSKGKIKLNAVGNPILRYTPDEAMHAYQIPTEEELKIAKQKAIERHEQLLKDPLDLYKTRFVYREIRDHIIFIKKHNIDIMDELVEFLDWMKENFNYNHYDVERYNIDNNIKKEAEKQVRKYY